MKSQALAELADVVEAATKDVLADADPAFDAEADPLVIVRSLLKSNADVLAKLSPDSPRRNPALAESRGLVKLAELLQERRASTETPEQAVVRRRKEDAETRRELERYVSAIEESAKKPTEDAPFGRCIKCSQPLQSL